MDRWKLLIARSATRAEEIHRIMGLGEGWKCVGFFDGLAGLPVERIVICDFKETYVDIERADEWLDQVARLRLLPGCQDNVWTV